MEQKSNPNVANALNIEWLKCYHGVLKSQHCEQCESERRNYLNYLHQSKDEPPKRIPILRGCGANGPCFCTGRCRDIIGYRDPLFPGER